jgi:hypothetical protein
MVIEVSIKYDINRRMFYAECPELLDKPFSEHSEPLVKEVKKRLQVLLGKSLCIIVIHKWDENDIIHGVREEGNIMPRRTKKSMLLIDTLPNFIPPLKDWLYATS